MALLHKPELILLDEPVTGLDDVSQEGFWNIVEQLRGYHTIVVITHNISAAKEAADFCGILHRGKVVEF